MAVEALIYWWLNNEQFHHLEKILIFCDSGGSNTYRGFLWKYTLQELFVDRFGISVYVCHYPPGTSKWNPIEHKLFSYISINRAGKPLRTYETAINYIKSTTTKTGLTVEAQLTEKLYKIGKKINKIKIDTINISNYGPNPDWNYCIKPRTRDVIKKMDIDIINYQNRPVNKRKQTIKVEELGFKGGKPPFEWLQYYLTYPENTIEHDISHILINCKPNQFGYKPNKKWSYRMLESICKENFNIKSASKSHIHRFLYDICWKP